MLNCSLSTSIDSEVAFIAGDGLVLKEQQLTCKNNDCKLITEDSLAARNT